MRIERLSRTGWLVAALFAPTAFTPGQTLAQEPVSEPERQARDAVGILMDNQDRCLKLAYGKLSLLEARASTESGGRETERNFEAENRTRIRVVKRAVDLAERLAFDLPATPAAARVAIQNMFAAQEELCEWATASSRRSSVYGADDLIRELGATFDSALRSLPPGLQLSSSERLAVVHRYRNELYGSGGSTTTGGVDRAMAEDRDHLVGPPISAKEYERKKKAYDEWLAEQQRREAEKLSRQAQRRAEQQERLHQQPREMPKLELKAPPKERVAGPAASPDAMARWHQEFTARIAPVKRSLARFLQVQANTRTLIMHQACQDLSRVTQNLLEEPAALEAPDPIVSQTLRVAFTRFKQASDSCIENRLSRTRDSIAAAERALGQAMQALKPYGLGL